MFQISQAMDFPVESGGDLGFVVDIFDQGYFDNNFFLQVLVESQKNRTHTTIAYGFYNIKPVSYSFSQPTIFNIKVFHGAILNWVKYNLHQYEKNPFSSAQLRHVNQIVLINY